MKNFVSAPATPKGTSYLRWSIIATLCVIVGFIIVFWAMRVSHASDLKSQLLALPAPSLDSAIRVEALKWNVMVTALPLPAPEKSVDALIEQATAQAEASVAARFSVDAVAQDAVKRASTYKMAVRGDRITFKTKSGKVVRGEFMDTQKKRYDTDIILRTGLYQGREVADEYRYMFFRDDLVKKINAVKAEVLASADARKEAELARQTLLNTQTLMKNNGYVFDNGRWMALRDKITANAQMVFEGEYAEYQKAVQTLLESETFAGHLFTLDQLGLQYALNSGALCEKTEETPAP